MEKKIRERIIKEIVIESNNLLELVQWNSQEEDLDKMRMVLSVLENKCAYLSSLLPDIKQ